MTLYYLSNSTSGFIALSVCETHNTLNLVVCIYAAFISVSLFSLGCEGSNRQRC